jgi:hypothetical protein
MLQAPQTIAPHAFFDIPSIQSVDDLDPTQYHDPSQLQLASGRSMATAMPMGAGGMRGVIVKKSTLQGAPLGHNADGVATRVIIDPDIPGEGFIVDPTQIRKEQMAQAVRHTGVDRPATLEDLRFRASATYRMFSNAGLSAGAPEQYTPQIRQSPVPLPGTYVVPEASEHGGQKPMEQFPQQQPVIQTTPIGAPSEPVRRGASAAEQQLMELQAGQGMPQPGPIPGVQQPQQQMPQQQMPQQPTGQQIPPIGGGMPLQPPNNVPSMVGLPLQEKAGSILPQAQAPQMPPQGLPEMAMPQPAQQGAAPSLFSQGVRAESNGATPPSRKVVFEIQGNPFKQECFYHEIIRQDQILVLIFDHRAVGFPCTFPQAVEQDMAVHIAGTSSVYLTQVPGIQYHFHDHWEHCILFIKEEYPYPGAQQAQPQPQRMHPQALAPMGG